MYGTPINIQNDPMPWFDINYNPENDVKAIISWVGPDHPMGAQIDGQSASFTLIVPNAFTRDFLPLQNMMKKKGFLWKSVSSLRATRRPRTSGCTWTTCTLRRPSLTRWGSRTRCRPSSRRQTAEH